MYINMNFHKELIKKIMSSNHTMGYGVARQIPQLFPSSPYLNFIYPLCPQFVPQEFLIIQNDLESLLFYLNPVSKTA